jgi:hypothetical protein
VGLVEDEHDPAATLGFLGGQRLGGLGDERSFVEPGRPAERGDDRRVEASGADGGVGLVDDGMPAGVQRGDRGTGGDGLAGPTSPVTTPIARSVISQVMRATASAWPWWRWSIEGARARPNRARVKP